MSLKQDKCTKGLILFFLIIVLFVFTLAVYKKSDVRSETNIKQHIEYNKIDNVLTNHPSDNTYFYTFIVTKDMVDKTVGIHTYNASLKVCVNNLAVYTNNVKLLNPHVIHYTSSRWHFIKVKESYVGKRMALKVYSYGKSPALVDDEIYIGHLGDLICAIMLKIKIELILSVLIFLSGMILGVIYILQKHNKIHTRPSNLWLCIGGFLFILFISSSNVITQFLIDSDMVRYYLYYLLLYLIPLILVNYISDVLPRLDTFVEYYMIVIVDLVLLLCQITQTYTFYQSNYIYLIFIASLFVALIVKIIKLKKKKGSRLVLSYLFIGFLIAISGNVIYYETQKNLLQPFLVIQVGILITMAVNIIYSSNTLVKDIEEIQENNAYREIALKDKLTGLYNRYAFEMDVSKITDLELEYLGIVSMDINNLKYYNDNFGHLQGDKLIKEAAKIISSVFPRVYRTGGDEFVALVFYDEVEILDEKKETLVRKTIVYNKDESHDIVLEIATGYSKYKFGDKSYEQILTRSDAEMYKHKEKLKERSQIKSVR